MASQRRDHLDWGLKTQEKGRAFKQKAQQGHCITEAEKSTARRVKQEGALLLSSLTALFSVPRTPQICPCL